MASGGSLGSFNLVGNNAFYMDLGVPLELQEIAEWRETYGLGWGKVLLSQRVESECIISLLPHLPFSFHLVLPPANPCLTAMPSTIVIKSRLPVIKEGYSGTPELWF